MNFIIKMKKLFFFYCFFAILFHNICYGEKISLNKVTVNGEEKLIVDSQTEELYFFKDYTIKIYGLEKLASLKKLTFNKTAFIENFDFITVNQKIETLVISDCKIDDFNFLKKMPNLKILVFQTCSANYDKIDLINNEKLEYLSITNACLEKFPDIENMPSNLQYLNLSFNKISSLSLSKQSRHMNVSNIFIFNNPITDKLNNFKVDIDSLPRKYRQYIK